MASLVVGVPAHIDTGDTVPELAVQGPRARVVAEHVQADAGQSEFADEWFERVEGSLGIALPPKFRFDFIVETNAERSPWVSSTPEQMKPTVGPVAVALISNR